MIRLTFLERRLPLLTPLVTAVGTIRERQVWLVSASDQHHTGWGEACPLPGFGGEDPAACRAALQRACTGDPSGIDPRKGLGPWESQLTDCPCARAALSGALLDLAARQAGLPLCRYLSTHAHPAVPVNALASDEADAVRLGHAGWRCVKLKSQGGPAADAQRIQRIHAALPQLRLRVDANGSWTQAHALDFLPARALVDYVEQPLPVGDLVGAAALRRAGLRVALDEGVRSPADVRAAIAAQATDVLVIKPSWFGGWDRLGEAVTLAQTAGVEVVLSSALGSAIDSAQALHAASALGLTRLAHGLDTGRLLGQDIGRLPAARSGMITLGAAPGLGLAVST